MLEIRLKTHREKMARIAVLELEIQGLGRRNRKIYGIHETGYETIRGHGIQAVAGRRWRKQH